MRVSFTRSVLGMAFLAAGFLLVSQSFGQNLLPAGSEGDPTAKKQPEEMQEIKDAVIQFNKRDFDAALKSLQEAAKKNADLPPAEILMGDLFASAKSGEGMLMYWEKASVKDPDDPEVYVRLGELALGQRRITDAELLFNKAGTVLAKFNKSAKRKALLLPRIYNGLATVAEVREQWQTAQQRLEELLKAEPKNAMAMQRIARSLFQQKDSVGALAKLREAAKVPKADVLTPEATLARFYQQFGDPDNAKKWIKAALQAAPEDLRTRLIATQIYLELGEYEEAKTQSIESLKLDPKSLEAKLSRGVVALFLKDYPTASSQFQEAALQSPTNFMATNNLALALAEMKDEAKRRRALEYAASNLKQSQNTPNATEAASTLGWVLYRIDPVKNLDEADKALGAAINSGQFNSDTAYYAAVIAYDKKQPDVARTLLKAALKSTVPWTMKAEAQSLLKKINEE